MTATDPTPVQLPELNPSDVFSREGMPFSEQLDIALRLGLAKLVEVAARAEHFDECRKHANLLGEFVLARRRNVSVAGAFDTALARHEEMVERGFPSR